jgi:hypothetical protein
MVHLVLRRAVPGLSLLVILALNAGALLSQAPSLPRVFVLDPGRRVVQSVALTDGSVTDSPRFEEVPDRMVLSPDGSRLLVFHEPAFQGSTWTQNVAVESRSDGTEIRRPKKTHSVSLVETRGMTVVGRIDDAGWNASPVQPRFVTTNEYVNLHEGPTGAWDEAGDHYTVLAWGRKENQPELVQLDVRNARVAARFPLDCSTAAVRPLVAILPGRTAGLLRPGGVLLVDLVDLAASRPVPLPGQPLSMIASPEGKFLYVFTAAGADGHARSVHAVSPTASAIVNSWTVGTSLTEPIVDAGGGRWLLAGVAPGRQASSLFEMREGALTRLAEFTDVVRSLRMTRRRLYALGEGSVQVLDAKTLQSVGTVRTPARQTGSWETVREAFAPPALLALDASEERGFLSYLNDDELSALDLKEFKVGATIDIVPGWKSFLGSIAASALATGHAQIAWRQMGLPGRAPNVEVLAQSAKYATIAVDPAGRSLFVLGASKLDVLDLGTNRRNSIDLGFEPSDFEFAAAGERVMVLVHGWGRWVPPLGRALLTAASPGKEWQPQDILIDTVTREKVLGPMGQCFYMPDGRIVVQHDTENIYTRDAATLAVLRKVSGFKRIGQLVFAPATLASVAK